MEHCNNCKQVQEFIIDGSDSTCTVCGIVKEIIFDTKPEWNLHSDNTYEQNNNKIRCSYGNTITNNCNGNFSSKWNFMTIKERSILQNTQYFQDIGELNNLSKNIINTAVCIYKNLFDELEKHGNSKKMHLRIGLKCGCLYFAFRKLGMPREKKEIAVLMNCDSKIVTKGCNRFLDIMGLKYITLEPLKATDYITRYSETLMLNNDTINQLNKIIDFLLIIEYFACSTQSYITAASIFFLSNLYSLEITKETISTKCGISNNILTKLYKEILLLKTKKNWKIFLGVGLG